MNIGRVWKKIVYVALFAVLLPISAYIFYGSLDNLQNAGALSECLPHRLVPVFLLGTSVLLCAVLILLFYLVRPVLERKGRIPAVWILFGGMILLQIITVLTLRTSLRYDHLKIFDTAVALLGQETIADTHFRAYFMKYPNNIPLCLFTYFWLQLARLLRIPRGYWMEYVKLVNLLFMNLGLWCTVRLLCRYRSGRTGIYFLLLLLVNPLWYLLGEMYYTSTISLAFSMGAVWLFDCARRTDSFRKKYPAYFCMGLLLAAGYKIRATVILTAASILIYGILQIRKRVTETDAKDLMRCGACLLAAFVGMAAIFFVYGGLERHYAGFDPSRTGYPAVHWIMMSAQGDGQYNSADDAYTGSFETKEERSRADLDLLKERIRQMGPGGLFRLFRNKLRVTFSDGTDSCETLFSTMRETSGFQKYINGGRSDYLMLYLHSYQGMLTGLLFLALLLRALKGSRDFLDLFAFHLCGTYLFYLIWEADNGYSIPFMLIFLLWAADGLVSLSGFLEGLTKQKSAAGRRFILLVSAVLMTAVIGLFVFVRAAVLRAGRPVREYAVLQDQETSKDLVLQTSFFQTFRTGQAFDHLDLWVANWDGEANDSVYDVRLLDEDGNMVAQGEVVGAQAPCINAYSIAFPKVVPQGEQTYTIQVDLRDPTCAVRTDFLYYGTGVWDTYPKGALYVPEEAENVDLAFAVYEEGF